MKRVEDAITNKSKGAGDLQQQIIKMQQEEAKRLQALQQQSN